MNALLSSDTILGRCISAVLAAVFVFSTSVAYADTVPVNQQDANYQAMTSIPDAQSKWKNCFKLCVTSQTECSPSVCSSYCEGEVIASGYSASKVSEMMEYNVLAIHAANCINKIPKMIQDIRDVTKLAHNSGLSLMSRAVVLIIDKIIDAVLQKILTDLTNQVCAVTTEIMNAADSVVRNAICLPTLKLGNPFDFKFNLGRMKCDGWSVDMQTGNVLGNPVQGVNTGGINIYQDTTGSNPTPTVIPDPATTTQAVQDYYSGLTGTPDMSSPTYYDQVTAPGANDTSVGVQ